MFRKSILATLAVASLGVLAVSTTDASAFAHFGGRGYARASFARVGTPRIAFRQNFAIRRMAFPKLYPPHNHWAWWWWHHHHHWIWGGPVIAGGTTYATTPSYASTPSYTSAPATNNCNCLTKQYTREGAVVFKDVCTNEMAMNPPAADTAPPTPASLQSTPMQQGYLQPKPAH